jgi:hypothetical protein
VVPQPQLSMKPAGWSDAFIDSLLGGQGWRRKIIRENWEAMKNFYFVQQRGL